ncbi:hypothetical protein CHRY9393_02195 [Chryseobacterium fistulae]|uniref:Uncharacterized protein n=1 Tax=Chryseobacterium fistulae TaxID=2675058 RepID=A0A6N4XPV4_9FLAO|nr:hypothetical protein CHRY9393_02195 [Chryseobacterium fistulae]
MNPSPTFDFTSIGDGFIIIYNIYYYLKNGSLCHLLSYIVCSGIQFELYIILFSMPFKVIQ